MEMNLDSEEAEDSTGSTGASTGQPSEEGWS